MKAIIKFLNSRFLPTLDSLIEVVKIYDHLVTVHDRREITYKKAGKDFRDWVFSSDSNRVSNLISNKLLEEDVQIDKAWKEHTGANDGDTELDPIDIFQ